MAVRNPSDLPALLTPGQCLLGVDYGQKRIGLAISDPGRILSTPLGMMERGKLMDTLPALEELIKERNIGALVLGLPLDLNGKDTPMSQSVRTFAKNIEPLGLPVVFWDERFSTAAVEREMIALDTTRAKREQKIDSEAAAYMLQGVLDFMRK